jgi:DNA-binding IclR family transcriptional regulator
MTATTTATGPRANMSALGKATAIVEAMAGACRLSDIARKAGLPTSSTHRILQELAELGWVEKTTDQGYRMYRLTDHLRGLVAPKTDRRRPAARQPDPATPGGGR